MMRYGGVPEKPWSLIRIWIEFEQGRIQKIGRSWLQPRALDVREFCRFGYPVICLLEMC